MTQDRFKRFRPVALRRRAAGVALGVVLVAALAGCASSSDTAGSSSAVSGTAAAAALTAAETNVEQYTATQPDITVEPLKEKPATGKTVGIVTCPFPSCQATTKVATEAAAALGWTVQEYVTEITPEAYQSTWNRMLQSPPDLIMYVALLPNATIAEQLQQVREKQIPTVAIATNDPPDDAMRAVVAGPAQGTAVGELMSDAVIADAKGGAKAVFVWDPTVAHTFGSVKDAFEERVTAAGGSVDVLTSSLQDVGKAVPGQVASYLQAHPDVKYVAFMVSDYVVGVPQALKSAGISGVKIVSRVPTATNLSNVKNGDEWVTVAEENSALAYRCIDTLARILEGSDFEASPVGWLQLMTKDNVTQTEESPVTPGSPEAFLAAWHVN